MIALLLNFTVSVFFVVVCIVFFMIGSECITLRMRKIIMKSSALNDVICYSADSSALYLGAFRMFWLWHQTRYSSFALTLQRSLTVSVYVRGRTEPPRAWERRERTKFLAPGLRSRLYPSKMPSQRGKSSTRVAPVTPKDTFLVQ